MSQHVESLIFSSEQPISPAEIKSVLDNAHNGKGKGKSKSKIKVKAIVKAVEELKERYSADDYSFEVVEIDGGYQFLSKAAYFESVAAYLKYTTKKRLSKAALETLSIIAYKQPVTKIEAEKIRGVSCDYSIQKLLEKELIVLAGRSDGPGRALLYGTSTKFMDYFGLKDLNDLPKLKDFNTPENTIGEVAPIEERIAIAENGNIETIDGAEVVQEIEDNDALDNDSNNDEITPSNDHADNAVEGAGKNIEIVEHINPEEFVEGNGLETELEGVIENAVEIEDETKLNPQSSSESSIDEGPTQRSSAEEE